jgi:prevent-host-death family protein
MTSDSRLTTARQYGSRPVRPDILDYVGAAAVEVVRPAVEPKTTAVGIRELARNVSAVVADVVRTGRPAIVTKHGAPFAAIIPIDRGEGTVLAAASEFLEDMAASDASAGRMRSSRDVFAELARFAETLGQTAHRGPAPGAGRHPGPRDHADRAAHSADVRFHGASAAPGASLGRGQAGRSGGPYPVAEAIPGSLP